MRTKLTVVSYCHEAHKPWIPFWAQQINKQGFRNFRIMFICHNWKTDVIENVRHVISVAQEHMDEDLRKCLEVRSFDSAPVIGEVIDWGCARVETEFFAHWDVDDVIHPKRLQLQSDFLDANPTVDFLGTRMVGFYGEPSPEMMELDYVQPGEPNLSVQTNDEIKACLINRGQNCLGHTTMIYRPEVMLRLGGFSRSDVKLDGLSPDFETWKKAIMAGYKFHRLPELCALWRLDSSSIRHV